jgi:hypothetical protein
MSLDRDEEEGYGFFEPATLEDDYGDESDPDLVCDDGEKLFDENDDRVPSWLLAADYYRYDDEA